MTYTYSSRVTKMNRFMLVLLLSINFYPIGAPPPPIALSSYNINGTNGGFIANLKSTDIFLCKAENGSMELPIGGKYRHTSNPCKVCTCTASGFICEDQCETTPLSTTSTTTESTTISTILSSSPSSSSSEQSITPSTVPSFVLVNSTINSGSGGVTASSTPAMGNGDDESLISPCARSIAAAREYAFVDCAEVYLAGKRTSGIYEIWPRTNPKPFRVFCDMDTDGGGWTVIQRRGDYNQQSNFFVPWSSYKRGFGDLTRDFWLGNEKIHTLSNQDEYRLHIDMEDFNNQSRFSDYEWFFITNEQTKYTLNLGRYMTTSTGGDSLYYNRGMRFTTRDQDNDQSITNQCAENYKSGWWHTGCTLANLNGLYQRGNDSTATGVFWSSWLGAKYSLKTCSIKIRPVAFNTEMLS